MLWRMLSWVDCSCLLVRRHHCWLQRPIVCLRAMLLFVQKCCQTLALCESRRTCTLCLNVAFSKMCYRISQLQGNCICIFFLLEGTSFWFPSSNFFSIYWNLAKNLEIIQCQFLGMSFNITKDFIFELIIFLFFRMEAPHPLFLAPLSRTVIRQRSFEFCYWRH